MVEDYGWQLTKTGGTTMRKEGYGTDIPVAKDLTNGDSLMEAVTKYA